MLSDCLARLFCQKLDLETEVTAEEYHSYSPEWKKHTTLIDVRRKDERDNDHIGGIHLPLEEIKRLAKAGQLEAKIKELHLENKHNIIIYCRRGRRSLEARKLLWNAGIEFDDIKSLKGGILSYRATEEAFKLAEQVTQFVGH